MAFGPDPLRNKGMEGIDEFQTDRVARAVGEAEKLLAAMKDAILRARDRELERRVDSFQATARAMFRTLEDDPRDLSAARKYLTVYLMGARDATVKFADIYSQSRSAEARADYVRLLDDLEANFTARTQKMLTDDHADLSIEIEVLRERLAREGVAT
jgi:5-bromo-4-chloroindolyl phosphate hydrolysis protein